MRVMAHPAGHCISPERSCKLQFQRLAGPLSLQGDLDLSLISLTILR